MFTLTNGLLCETKQVCFTTYCTHTHRLRLASEKHSYICNNKIEELEGLLNQAWCFFSHDAEIQSEEVFCLLVCGALDCLVNCSVNSVTGIYVDKMVLLHFKIVQI